MMEAAYVLLLSVVVLVAAGVGFFLQKSLLAGLSAGSVKG